MPQLLDWLCANEADFRKNRLPSLFSDLIQQKTANPDGFAANCRAWQNGLTHATLAGQLPTEQRLILQTSAELLADLTDSTYGQPTGLGAVFDDAVRNGRMLDLSDFKSAEKSIYHKSWLPSPWAILRWGLNQAGLGGARSYDNAGRLRSGQLVMVDCLEQVSKQISAWHASKSRTLTDCLMSRQTFAGEISKLFVGDLSPQDVDVLLRYLERDKGLLVYDGDVVKLKDSETATSTNPITTEDRTIVNLKTLISSITLQTETLTARIAELQLKAQSAVASKNKTTALMALRSKKLAEGTLQSRSDTLQQLEGVFAKIEDAHDQVQIVQAMQQSTQVLRTLNQRVGGADRADDIVQELREQMSQTDEVGQMLREPLNSDQELAEFDVDEELEAMEREEQQRKDELEAEATREELRDLDRIEADRNSRLQPGAETSQQKQVDASLEKDLQDSTERLGQVRISSQDESSRKKEPVAYAAT